MTVTYAAGNDIVEYLFGQRALTLVPANTLYVGLLKDTPTESGSFSNEVSASGTAYARVSIDNTSGGAKWSTATAGVLSNAAAIEFTESSASWGTITHVFLADSATVGAGNMLYYEELVNSRTVDASTTVYFPVGSFEISIA